MLKPSYHKQFKKDIKKIKKRGKEIDKLKKVMSKLINEEVLDKKYKKHSLLGRYTGCQECHIEPDWLLIYIINNETKTITFIRSGTHSDLFK